MEAQAQRQPSGPSGARPIVCLLVLGSAFSHDVCGLKSIARPRDRQPQRVWGFPPLRLPDSRPLSRLLETVLSTPATTPCMGLCFFRPVRSRAWAHRAASLAPNSRPLTTIPGRRAGGGGRQHANEPTGRWTGESREREVHGKQQEMGRGRGPETGSREARQAM